MMLEVTGAVPTGPAIVADQITVTTVHPGPVNSVVAARLPNGRIVIATGAGDGILRRFDATTGALLGEGVSSQNRRILAVTSATLPDGRVILAAGGDDGIVRRIDAATGRRVGSGMTGHSGTVWSVTSATLPDGRVILATGGNDRTVRLFDAATGRSLREPLIGHSDWVRCVTSGALPDGRVILASGSDDGTVMRYDAATGDSLGEPLIGHGEWVRCVAMATLPDGRVIIASGGGDGTIRRFDAATGDAVGDPIVTGNRRVLSLVTLALPDGVALVTGGGDGRVLCFDAVTGAALGEPLKRHEDGVLALTALPIDDRVLLATAGADRTLALSALPPGFTVNSPTPPRSGHLGHAPAANQAAPEAAPEPELAEVAGPPTLPIPHRPATGPGGPAPALAAVDRSNTDALGRHILAEHAQTMLAEIAAVSDTRSAVVQLDGRPGAGKSGVARAVAETMPDNPIVITYDALSEPNPIEAPYALSRAVRVAVFAERSLIARTLGMLARALTRPRARLAVGLPAGLTLLFAAALLTGRPGGLWSATISPGAYLAEMLAAITTAFALLTVAAIIVLWAAQDRPWGHHLLGVDPHSMIRAREASQGRPILLIVEHLDRVRAETTVALLDRILTCTHPADAGARGTGPSTLTPATPAFYVLIPADGRWLRAGLEGHFSDVESLTSSIGSLGGNLLQAVIDHVVLIPALSRAEVVGYLYRLSETRRNIPGPRAIPRQREGLEVSPVLPPDPAALPAYAAAMPSTPRMLKRIHNAVRMLAVLQTYLGHSEPPDTVVRAAILMVRFPALVDLLLTAAAVPAPEPLGSERASSVWQRPDLRDVLGAPGDQLADLRSVARCYGREDLPLTPAR